MTQQLYLQQASSEFNNTEKHGLLVQVNQLRTQLAKIALISRQSMKHCQAQLQRLKQDVRQFQDDVMQDVARNMAIIVDRHNRLLGSSFDSVGAHKARVSHLNAKIEALEEEKMEM